MRLIFLCCLIILIYFSSCQAKFDKVKWRTREYTEAPPEGRKRMLNDLITNYKLKGLKKSELVDLLGEPNYGDDSMISYLIEEDYGTDIDPIYTKFLQFTFNKDSIIEGFRVDEWKK